MNFSCLKEPRLIFVPQRDGFMKTKYPTRTISKKMCIQRFDLLVENNYWNIRKHVCIFACFCLHICYQQ